MMRTFKRKTERGKALPSTILSAVREVKLKNQTIRKTAKKFGVNYRTLARYCNKITPDDVYGDNENPSITVGYTRNRLIFSPELEEEMVSYIAAVTEVYSCLTRSDIRKMAYHFALSKNIAVATSWHKEKRAGIDWLAGFLKRHSDVLIQRKDRSIDLIKPAINCNSSSPSHASSSNEGSLSNDFQPVVPNLPENLPNIEITNQESKLGSLSKPASPLPDEHALKNVSVSSVTDELLSENKDGYQSLTKLIKENPKPPETENNTEAKCLEVWIQCSVCKLKAYEACGLGIPIQINHNCPGPSNSS